MLRTGNDIVSEINFVETKLMVLAAKLEAIQRLGAEEYLPSNLSNDDIPANYIVDSLLKSIRNAVTELGFDWRSWKNEDSIKTYMENYESLKNIQDRLDKSMSKKEYT